MYIRLGPIPKDIGYPIGRKEKAQAAEVTLFEGNRHCFGKVSKTVELLFQIGIVDEK